jgi:hypothetical protein
MLDELFARQIRRTTRNRLIIGVFFLGVTLASAWHYRNYLLSVVRGPAPIDDQQLASSTSLNPLLESFVRVHGSEIAKTGAREVARDSGSASGSQNSNRVIANIMALKVGDRYLLSKVPINEEGLDLSGELVEMPAAVRKIVITDHLPKHPGLDRLFYPCLLDTTKSRFGDPWALLLGAFFFLLGAACLGQGVYHAAVPESHPVVKALRRYGDPGNISIQIAQELRVEGDREKFDNARITSDWLVEMSSLKTAIVRLADLLWAYPKVIKHYHNFIPTGKSYFVVVRDRAGQSIEVSVKKDQQPMALESLSRRNPWAVYGFDQQLAKGWPKNRAELIQVVDERRAALNSESKQAAAPQSAGVLAGKI